MIRETYLKGKKNSRLASIRNSPFLHLLILSLMFVLSAYPYFSAQSALKFVAIAGILALPASVYYIAKGMRAPSASENGLPAGATVQSHVAIAGENSHDF